MIDQQYNIAFDLYKHLQAKPEQIIFTSEKGQIQAKEFANVITNFALHLKHNGVESQDLVGLDIDDTIIALAMVTALGAIGASWIKINQTALKAQLTWSA